MPCYTRHKRKYPAYKCSKKKKSACTSTFNKKMCIWRKSKPKRKRASSKKIGAKRCTWSSKTHRCRLVKR